LVEEHDRNQGQEVVLLVVLPVRREAGRLTASLELDLALLEGNNPAHPPAQTVAHGHSWFSLLLLGKQSLGVVSVVAVDLKLDLLWL